MAYGPGKDSVPEMTTKTRDMHEKLDTDFMYFLTNPHLQLRLLPSPQDRKNAQDWLQRLVGWMPEDVASKRERNVYLSRLIQGIQEGVLTGIFAKPPQRGLLKPTKEVFDVMSLDKLMEVEGDTVEDLHVETELDMRQLTSKSKDGRTYLATRTLPNGEGIFGYVAVSIGGGDSQWIDPDRRRKAIRRAEETEGDATERDRKTVDMTEFNQLNSMTQWLLGGCGAERVQGEAIRCPPQSAEHVLQVASRYRHGRGLKTVLDSRRPPTDRAQLAAFYKYLLQKIVEEMTEMETGRVKPPCAMDPLVMRMMLRLRNDLMSKGSEPCDRYTLLDQIKRNIISSLKKMEERSAALERATERLKGPGPAHTRLEVEERELRGSPTSAKKSMTCQEAVSTLEQWRDLIAQPPSTRTVKMLKRNYPQPVIDTVLKMLEKERWSVLEGAMAVYDRYDWSMRKDILQALHSGMESYRLATEEMGVWRKLAKLVGELVDEVRAEFMDRLEVAAHNQDIIDAKRHKKVAVAGAMETAKDRLKNVRAKQMMLEDMVNSMWTETKAMESRGHGEEDRERTRHEKLSETLRNLQEAIAAQDDMLHLREAINSSQQNEGSFFEDAYM